MLKKLTRRWQVVPLWVKTVVTAALLLGLSLAHTLVWPQSPPWALAIERLLFLPLFMASLLFGLWGGLATAALICLNYLPLLLYPAPGQLRLSAGVILGAGLFFLTGAITGALADRERREAKRLKEAEELALLGTASAAVAHELKTPLVVIGGFTQRLRRSLEPDHPHRRSLDIIIEQTRHMENLLREMLSYSRNLQLELAPHPVDKLVQDALVLAAVPAETAGVRLLPRLEAGSAQALLDADKIKQVILNLVNNALEASPPQSQIELVTANSGGEIYLEVRDEGSGIAPELVERIFSPFVTTKRRGTGLGLAISRKIVHAHNGRLEVKSAPGKGSSFRIYLPMEGPA